MAADRDKEAAGPDAGSKPGIGARLSSARVAQGLAIEDVSAELRIAAEALTALEEERFEALGAPVFAKGYLKQYGALLGLDVAELVADYERTSGRTGIEIAPSKTIRLRDERQITVWVVTGMALALVIVFLLLWWLRQPGALIS